MDRVYFRQEVLMKYEGTSSFEVNDNGAVRSKYWGLVRSSSRIGNELITIAIGDFAQGVTLEEWPHWKQYVVEPPSAETLQAITVEQTIPDGVNSVINTLEELNQMFAALAASMPGLLVEPLWQGSVESLAGDSLSTFIP